MFARGSPTMFLLSGRGFLSLLGLLFACLPARCTGFSFHPAKAFKLQNEKSDHLLGTESLDSHWNNQHHHRRAFLASSLLLIAAGPAASPSANAIAPPRDVDVGGGFDLLGKPRLAAKDATYPYSMEGVWTCNRVVTQVEGDSFQAESAWRALGGGNLKNNKVETFSTKFIRSELFGERPGGFVVTDRGYELSSRGQMSAVSWSADRPDALQYDKTRVTVVKRTVEPPSDEGFGFNELYRIDDGLVTRAAQVKRRYRRAYDPEGNRVVEGLEIMKTFRVLDGIAGTEKPTSTTKSQIRLTRS
jgi:hypothetical protein